MICVCSRICRGQIGRDEESAIRCKVAGVRVKSMQRMTGLSDLRRPETCQQPWACLVVSLLPCTVPIWCCACLVVIVCPTDNVRFPVGSGCYGRAQGSRPLAGCTVEKRKERLISHRETGLCLLQQRNYKWLNGFALV